MKIIFIRHGDPDYVNDTLTEKGRREAELLSHRVIKWDVKDFYCSPLGRAKDTAAYSMDKLNRTAEEKDWLREFFYPVKDPVTGQDRNAWDFMPEYWTKEPLLYDKDRWLDAPPKKGYSINITKNGIRHILKTVNLLGKFIFSSCLPVLNQLSN